MIPAFAQIVSQRFLETFLRVCAAALTLSIFAFYLYGPKADSSLLRGDFPAFYTAAKLVEVDEGRLLYDRQTQSSIENQYWPSYEGRYLAFVYPAPYAKLLSPLAQLSPKQARLVFVLLQLSFVIAAACLLSIREGHSISIGSIALYFVMFGPTLLGLVAGQSVGILLLLIAAYLKFRTNRPALSGSILGLLMFKPQYVLLLGAFELGQRNWRLLTSLACTCVSLFLFWLWKYGAESIFAWVAIVTSYQLENALLNAGKSLSLAEFLSPYRPELYAHISKLILLVGILFLALSRRVTINLLLPLVLLFSPHSLVYDGCLLLPGIIEKSVGKLLTIFLLTALLTAFFPLGMLALSGL